MEVHCSLRAAWGRAQAADATVAAREQAARAANQLYEQAADQAAVARDQAAQALGEGIDKVGFNLWVNYMWFPSGGELLLDIN